MAIPFLGSVTIPTTAYIAVHALRVTFTVNGLSVDPNFTFDLLVNGASVLTVPFTETTPQAETVTADLPAPVMVDPSIGDYVEFTVSGVATTVDWLNFVVEVEFNEAERDIGGGMGVNAVAGDLTNITLNYTVLDAAFDPNFALRTVIDGTLVDTRAFTEGAPGPNTETWGLGPITLTGTENIHFHLRGNADNAQGLAWANDTVEALIAVQPSVYFQVSTGDRRDLEVASLRGLRLPAGSPGTLKVGTTGWAYVDAAGPTPKNDDGFALRRMPSSIGLLTLPPSVSSFTTGLPTDLRGLAFDGTFLLTLRTSDNLVRFIDPSSGSLAATYNLGANYQQVFYLGFISGGGSIKRYAAVGTAGVIFFDVTAVANDGIPSVSTVGTPITSSVAGGFFDGNHFWVVRNSVGTDQLVYFPAARKTTMPGSVTATTTGTIVCPNTNLFSPVITGDGSRYIYIIQEGDPINALYRFDTTSSTVTQYLFGSGSDPRSITFDGQYLWAGLSVGGSLYRVAKIDPALLDTNSLLPSGMPMEENGILVSNGGNPSFIAFDGRRVLVSTSDATTGQRGLFAVNPERFDSTGAIYANTNTFLGSSTGYNLPKGIVAVHEGPGSSTAVYVVSTLGIHKAYDPVPADLGNTAFRGGQVIHMRTETGSVLLSTADYMLRCNHSTPVSITLPTNARQGQTYLIKDVSSGGAATNNITISQSGGTIDGAATYVIATNAGAVGLIYGGSNTWNVF